MLELTFNNYGIVQSKKIYDLENMNDLKKVKETTQKKYDTNSKIGKLIKSLEQKINNLETDLHIMGTLVLDSLVGAVRALEDKDTLKASEVMDKDDEIDDAYMKIDQDWFELMATEQPVASDLRLSTSILQASLHLERLGDLSVYLGKTTHEIHDLPIPESLHKIVVEMGDMVIDMASSALESLKNRDAELALSTARKDELINSLYNKMLNEVPNISGNKDLYSGLFRLITCVRTLERGGDHAVDICELASFLVTGEFKEF